MKVLLKHLTTFTHSLYNHRYCGLRTIVSNKHRLFSYYSHCIPKQKHILKKQYGKITPNFGYGGEDAFFTYKLNISSDSSPLFFIGVADGVGSWKPKKAKDAARYAQELMLSGIKFLSTASIEDIESNKLNGNNCYNLSHKIASFCSDYVNNKMCYDGASTLCILNIDELVLNAFNLGDSGFSIYRHKNERLIEENDCYEVIYKSPSQEQGFGIPYQLGSHPTANSIDDGYCLQHFNLKSLDIVIVGSDGLWDNLFDHEVSTIVCNTMTKYYKDWKNNNNKTKTQQYTFNNYVHNKIVNGDLTHKIIKQAFLNSIDKKKTTPWSQAMTQTVDMVYNGGKQDDITCVVVFIH